MRGLMRGLLGVCVILTTAGAQAATVEGTVTYDGELVMEAFDDITGFSAYVYDYDTFQRISGTTDPATSTYEVADLPVGHSLAVFAEIDRSSPANQSAFDPGDLQSGSNVEITDPSQVATADIGVRMVMRIRTPFDSAEPVPANGANCPIGYETSSPAQLSWDEVAGAQSYEVRTFHRTCDGTTLSGDTLNTTGTSAQITFGVPDEDYALIQISCPGAVSTNLCFIPYIEYLDNNVQAIVLRAGGSPPGDRGMHHADAYFIPAVASTPGVPPAFWTSTITLTSVSDMDSTVKILFTPSDGDGSFDYLDTEVDLPARSTIAWGDVVQSLFGIEGVGSLELRGTDLVVASRTSTPASPDGSYGQGIPAVGPEQVLSLAGTPSATIGSVAETDEFRSNLGLCETWGENATVEVVISDDTGDVLGSRIIHLRPYENTQINRVVRNVTSMSNLDNGVVTVSVVGGNGRVAVYLSTVDNATGDPTYLAIVPSRPTGG